MLLKLLLLNLLIIKSIIIPKTIIIIIAKTIITIAIIMIIISKIKCLNCRSRFKNYRINLIKLLKIIIIRIRWDLNSKLIIRTLHHKILYQMNNNRHNQLKNSKTSLKTLILKLIIIINNYKIKINKKYN
jgi:hypothetical protein